MTAFIAGVVVGVGSYLSRSIFILVLARRRIPDRLLVMLQFVAPAVLGSLVVALLIGDEGSAGIGIPEVAALSAGGATAYKSRSHTLTLIVGMGTLWVTRALL